MNHNFCSDFLINITDFQAKRRQRSATFALKRRTKSSVDVRMHYQKMFQLNHEIDKFKRSLESIRPKSKGITFSELKKQRFKPCRSSQLSFVSYSIGDSILIPPYNMSKSSIEGNKNSDENTHESIDERHCRTTENVENNQELVEFCPTSEFTSIPSISILPVCSIDDCHMDTFGHSEDNQLANLLSPSSFSTSPSISVPSDCWKIDETSFGNELDFGIKPNDATNSENLKPMTDVTIDNDDKISPHSFSTSTIQDDKVENDSQHEMNQRGIEDDNEATHELPITPKSILIPISMPSECVTDTTHESDAIDINSFIQENHIYPETESVSPCSSTQTDLRTVIRKEPQYFQSDDDLELIIKPTITVNLQDTIRSNLTHPIDCTHHEFYAKSTEFHRESQIAVCQQMSIFIKKPSKEVMTVNNYNDSCFNEHTEGSDIINQVFSKKPQENFILLQRYFLKWVHFTTIEKLKRRNPAQTRLQKMEAFLQNITLERKRAINKLRRPGNILSKRDDDCRRVTMHDPNMNSPRLLERTFNNKYDIYV